MLIRCKVCAEFHDKAGAVLFNVRPADLNLFIEAPESIMQDPLFEMLVADHSLDATQEKMEARKLEKAAEKAGAEKAPKSDKAAAPEGTKVPEGKPADKH